MKNIACLYPIVGESWGITIGFERCLKEKGFNVDHYDLEKESEDFNILISRADDYDYIIIFNAGHNEFLNRKLEELRSKSSTKIALEMGDEPQCFSVNSIRAKFVDLVFTPDKRCDIKYKQMGINSIWATHWCDDFIFYNKNKERKNKCVTSCLGFRPMLNEFKQIYKDKFDHQVVWSEKNTDFFNSGTFTYQFARYDEITRRIFEAGGCGNAVITNRISPETGIYDLFPEDECIAYFSTAEEAFEKMNRLYEDDEYRNKLATNLYNKITSDHLVGNRVDYIINTLESLG